jgi:hypothetical protein
MQIGRGDDLAQAAVATLLQVVGRHGFFEATNHLHAPVRDGETRP